MTDETAQAIHELFKAYNKYCGKVTSPSIHVALRDLEEACKREEKVSG